jgi:hydroxyacylglutathione hydrolase
VLSPDRLAKAVVERAFIIDARPAAEHARGHIPGSLNIPRNKSFVSWAGWLAPYDRDLYLILDRVERRDEAVRDLRKIGLDRVAGVFGPEAVGTWAAEGRELQTIRHMEAGELANGLSGQAAFIDVRTRAEWEAGHVPGTQNFPLGGLEERIDELPAGRPLVVYCQGGSRSAIAASLLQSRGINDVVDLAGGFSEWQRAAGPVERAGSGHAGGGALG